MGARFYDEALSAKIGGWLKNPNLKILKPSEVSRFLEIALDEGKDKLELPQFVLIRDGYRILNRNKQVKSFDGVTIRVYDKDGNLVDNGNAGKINAIPIQLDYQFDIYTYKMEDCDEYVRQFIFNFINFPTGTVIIPYNDFKIEQKFTVHINENVEDNSDIPQRLFPAQFTRYTLNLTIDDAYLFSLPIKENVYIDTAGIEIKSSDGSVQEEIQDEN